MSGLEGGPEKVVKLSDRGRGEGREPFLRRSPSSICQIKNYRIIELRTWTCNCYTGGPLNVMGRDDSVICVTKNVTMKILLKLGYL